jgi:glucan 1,3-beta-glucosidase
VSQTEEDFAAIAAAGLNWVRIPLPYWAIEVWDGEPFLPKVSWKYFLKAIKWARKYGLRINLDLHAVPGSQNSWNHSGREGHGPNFMFGVMGIANAQRTMNYIRYVCEYLYDGCMLNSLQYPYRVYLSASVQGRYPILWYH